MGEDCNTAIKQFCVFSFPYLYFKKIMATSTLGTTRLGLVVFWTFSVIPVRSCNHEAICPCSWLPINLLPNAWGVVIYTLAGVLVAYEYFFSNAWSKGCSS